MAISVLAVKALGKSKEVNNSLDHLIITLAGQFEVCSRSGVRSRVFVTDSVKQSIRGRSTDRSRVFRQVSMIFVNSGKVSFLKSL